MSDFEHNNILTLDFVGKTVTNEDIYSESMVLSKSLCDESSLTFGKCNSACFKVKIFDEDNFQYKGMVVSPTLQIWDEDSQEYITNNLGTFVVESEQRTNDVHYKEITCYDKMYYFGKIDITEKLISRINESQMSSVGRHSVSGMFPSDPTISRNNRYMSKNKAVVKVSAADMKRGMSNGSGEIINGIEVGSVLNETIVFNKYPNGIGGAEEKINNFEPLNGLLEHILDEYNIEYEELPSYGNTIYSYGWKTLMDNSTKYSLLDFIQFYAQLCGCFGFINGDNKLEFKVIGSSSSAKEYTQDDYNQSGLNYQEVKTTVPTRVILESQLEKTLASRDYYYGVAEENFYLPVWAQGYTNVNPSKTTFANSILMFALSGYGDDAKFVNGKDNDTWNGTWGSPDTRVITISNNPLVRRQGRTAINEMAGHLRNAYAAIGQYNIGSLELNASDRPDIINSELGSWISAVGNYKTVKFPILKMEISGIENVKVRFEANGDTTNSGSISSSISSSYTQNGGSGSGSGYGNVADVINALRINVDFLQAEKISTSELDVELANIKTAYIDYANIKSAFIDDLVADTIATEKLSASLITASTIEAITLRVEDAIVDNLDAKYAKIDFANVGSEAVKELFVNVGFMQDVTIENGKITGTLSGVRIIADVIEANEIIAGDMIVSHKNEDGTTTHFKINAEESGLTTEEISSLDYEHYLNGTDIVAHSITANEITTSNIKGAYGWINLAQGTFNYGDKLIWDGTNLTLDGNIYVRDGLDYLFTAIQGVYDEDGEVVTSPKVTIANWEVTSNSLTNEYFTLSTSVSEDNIGSTSLYADNTNLLTLFGNVLSLSGNSIEIEGNNAISIDAPTITIDGSIKLAGTITQEGSKQTATTYTRTNVFTDLTNIGKATDSFVSMTFSSYGEAKNHASANLVGKYIVPQNTGDATTSYPKITSVVYQNYNVIYTLNKASNIARDGKFKVQTITSQTSVLSNPFKVDENGNVTCRAVNLGSSGSISSGNVGAVSGGVVYSYCYGKRIVGVTNVTCSTSSMIAKETTGTATGSFTAISGATSYRVIPLSTAQYNIVSDNPTISGTTVSVKCYNISGASHTLTARCLVLGLG